MAQRRRVKNTAQAASAAPKRRATGRATETVKTKAASREVEHIFRRTFDLAGSGIAHVSLDGYFLRVNRSLCAMLGYTEQELVGHTVKELSHPEDRDETDAGRARVRSGELESTRIQKRYLHRSGATVWVDVTVALMRDTAEKPLYEIAVFDDDTERKKTEAALRESEARYRSVADSAKFAIVTSDAAGSIVSWNPAAERMFGYADSELIGQALTLLIPQRFQAGHLAGMQRLRSGGEKHVVGRTVELAGRRKDGSEFPLELSLAEWTAGEDRFYTGIIRDITERKEAEAKIQRMTQLYAALSQCNQAIVRCTSEEELLAQICGVAVAFGGMEIAWIGLIDPDTRMIRIAASEGSRAEEYLQGIEISVDAGSPLGHGPSAIAIREKRPVWQQDFQKEPRTAPWHERRARFGWGASATLPLYRNDIPVGVLTLYAAEVNAFDSDARALLTEMATDISFALDNFAREAARVQASIELRAKEEQFRGLVEQSIAGIVIIQDDKLAYANPRFAEIFGYDCVDELIGRESLSLIVEEGRAAALEQRRRIESGAPSISYSFTALRKDGSTAEIGVHIARATHNGRPAVIGLLQDISEKKRAEEQIQRYLKQLEVAFMSTVEVATALSELRDPYTAGHEQQVGKIAAAIGAELGLDARRIEGLRVAGCLHDVGKITIPAEILSKPGKLSAIEYELIKGHPQSGYNVLKDVEFPWPVAQVALQHHERLDGSGYPQGLKGKAILFEARIMAVADVMEAMSSHRPYRPGLGIDTALAEIRRGRGSAYDSDVVDACIKLFLENGALLA